jgi:outer membrane autotransporter protein
MALAMAIPFFANAAETSGFYLDGAVGRASSHIGESDNTVSLLDAGYRWSWFGLDVGYVDMSRANSPIYKDQMGIVPQLSRYGSKESGVTLDASGRWQIGDRWYYTLRAGLYSWHNTFYQTTYAPAASHSKSTDSSVSWNAGLGVGYDFTDNFGVGLRYDAYHGGDQTTTPLSLTAEVRF